MKDTQNPSKPEKRISQKPFRVDWEKQLALLAEKKDDPLIDYSLLNEFDTEEWF